MDDEKKKVTPCPVCRQPLILQYDKEDPRIRQDPVTSRLRIPMRCTRCGINVEIAVDPKALEEMEQDDD
jgi:RNase P subunit RPR2